MTREQFERYQSKILLILANLISIVREDDLIPTCQIFRRIKELENFFRLHRNEFGKLNLLFYNYRQPIIEMNLLNIEEVVGLIFLFKSLTNRDGSDEDLKSEKSQTMITTTSLPDLNKQRRNSKKKRKLPSSR